MRNLFVLVTSIFVFSLNAQVEPKEICGYQHEVERILSQNQDFYKFQDQWIKSALQEYELMQTSKRSIVHDTLYYSIPVVFHVLWNNSIENIPDSNMVSQINELNRAFRKLTQDTVRTRAVFKSLAADVKIQFYLASVDPDGNPTTGITRTYTNNTTFAQNTSGAYTNGMKYVSQGGKAAWDPTKYLNIWVCNMAFPNYVGITLGFATPPNGAPNWGGTGITKAPNHPETGVVLHYRIVGRNVANPFGKYTEAKTAVHEIGHYLGLRHIWGDGSFQSGCNVDDGIDDTPNARAQNSTCDQQNSCGIGVTGDLPDMTENYMDYALDGCASMFTKKQAYLMQYVLRNFRSDLPQLSIVSDTIEDNFRASIYPIPVSQTQKLNVNIVGAKNLNLNYQIIGMTGQEIIKGVVKNGNNEINVQDLATGVYFFLIKNKDGAVLQKERIVIL